MEELSKKSFSSLGLSQWLVDALASVSIHKPSQIQSSCIPQILAGRDCIGGAKTGSGKTAAFALPILQKWSRDPYGVFALVLTPTRELAIQISDQFAALGASMDLKFATVVGGLDMLEQSSSLARRPHVVIATPGRLADIIRSNGDETVGGLRKCQFLVLDEADRLLNPSFADELEQCMSLLPRDRQTLLFTATITDAIRKLSQQPGKNGKAAPFLHEVGGEGSLTAVPSTLTQGYLFIPSQIRESYLHDLLSLPKNESKSSIIFVNRTRTAELLRRMLRLLEYRVTALHSDLAQHDRISNLARFRAGSATVLIATDVASRGLDIPLVEMVINFDLPRDADDYIHRVGRTARANRPGESISLVSEHDVDLVHAIESRTGTTMAEYEGCKEARVLENIHVVGKAKREAQLGMTDEEFGSRRERRNEKNGVVKAQSRATPYARPDRVGKVGGKSKS
ncbi:ATP-dependent RNA helicase dbp8 [Taphrina deformans PYCC 5710]|uniref:ATP-dependent RNA helicase dbp8 n=1 Tax=Taphrina deformans (strain PYCC 5710 / ATCC 11124 / CBS 356.35 / IMI 108563 / JCM 9778 / NBRC 8474) TaxID=1097556 RepID=R4XCB2_TAPDE|nr:ATP-dependent RNA helicase dbp8 [Taphrina deformans PYCC 5710]|eukprot:CCG83215.1 ATP-dependent RNA helicase dbp8 [Taphrina deformans PYCC 5710]